MDFPRELLGDGECDTAYNTAACNFDLGDCCEATCEGPLYEHCSLPTESPTMLIDAGEHRFETTILKCAPSCEYADVGSTIGEPSNYPPASGDRYYFFSTDQDTAVAISLCGPEITFDTYDI